jgi:DNA polymerase III epsilon subunit-like protein
MYLVYDLETTGLPIFNKEGKHRFHSFRNLKMYDPARIVSISWILLDECGIITKQAYHIVRPLDFTIDNDSIATKIHGITSEIAVAKGVLWEHVYNEFVSDLRSCHTLVAHNLQFDFSIMLSEMFRYNKQEGVTEMLAKKRLCTLLMGRTAMNQKKAPKLSELYKFLYNEDIENAHDAFYDTLHCCKCLIAMMKVPSLQSQLHSR